MPKEEHTGLGFASLVLGITAIINCTLVYFLMIFVFPTHLLTIFIMDLVNIFIFGALPLDFGAVSYRGKRKDSFGLIGLKLGIISIIVNIMGLILIILAASAL